VVSEQCIQETQVLQTDPFLDMVQDDLYTTYLADFTEICSLWDKECSLQFDGENKTYAAACIDKGGQVLKRDVQLKCGIPPAVYNYDLGVLPTCIGQSCDVAAVEPHELDDTRVEELLAEMKLFGCDTDFSGATTRWVGGGFVVAVTVLTFILGVFVV